MDNKGLSWAKHLVSKYTRGVSQGIVLGTLLFLVHVTDVTKSLNNGNRRLVPRLFR